MTNETTASQPKSIGDDAQFLKLIVDLKSAEGRDAEWIAVKEVTQYVDSKLRAPAAQASATIQAAPDYRVGWFWSSANPGKKVRCLAEGKEIADYEKRGDFIGWCDAATIQEPVMVAEPVGQVQDSAAQIGWFNVKYETFFKLGELAHSDYNTELLNSGEIIPVYRTAQLVESTIPAAPMVADPAGVDVEVVYLRKMFGFWHVYPKDTEGTIAFSAATVKAAPSEALELAGMVVKATFGDHKILVPRVDLSGKGIGTLVYFAAPLADKTGGGE